MAEQIVTSNVEGRSTRRTGLLILLLAYTGFVGLGLINSLMGVAWPSVRQTFGLPLDALGILLIGNTIGYMIASALSGGLMSSMNAGTLLALSCGGAGVSLLASGSAPFWLLLVVLGFTSGLSAGAIDGSLNAYAAAHFSPRAMNWLHACFGIGATLGPAIMTWAVTTDLGWRAGFWIVGAALLVLAAGFLFTRQLWGAGSTMGADASTPAGAPLLATLRLPLAWLGIVLFFVYCGVEVAAGNWIFSLLTEARGVPVALAGAWVSLYWGSLTIGRILFGFAVQRVAPSTLLRWCMVGAVLSALLIWLNVGAWLTFAGIALMGLVLAPQFPLLMSATPGYLGPRHAANGVGFQVAAASLGGALLPSLVGVLARANSLEVLGPCLFVASLIMTGLYELLVWKASGPAREANAGL